MRLRRLRCTLGAVAALAMACATDPFAWREDRPEPRVLVRRHLIRGASRVLDAPYADVYRAAARYLDASTYYSVARDYGALYADDFHGSSSVGAYLHPTDDPARTQLEILYLRDDEASLDPSRRSRVEKGYLEDIAAELARPGSAAAAGPHPDRRQVTSDVDGVAGLAARRRPRDAALIVGAERHAWLGEADCARRDAETFRRHAETVLGIPPERVILLTDAAATRAEISDALERLAGLADEDSRVWFYFAGNGGSDENSGIPYLTAWDSDPRYWTTTTLPLAELVRALEKVRAAEIIAVVDASFSGAGGRTWSESEQKAPFPERRPAPGWGRRLSILYAAAPGQPAWTLEGEGHGLMTYYLLRGLRGEAASGRRLDLEDLARYVHRGVRERAKTLGREQTPTLDATLPDLRLW